MPADNSQSPRTRRPMWNQIVRGGESEQQQHPIAAASGDSQSHSVATVTVAAVAESNGPASPSGFSGLEDGGAENGGGGGAGHGVNGNAGKRPAWKKPAADGPGHAGEAVGAAVMGAESWPALTGSTRVARTASSGTLKSPADGSSSGQVDCFEFLVLYHHGWIFSRAVLVMVYFCFILLLVGSLSVNHRRI